MRSLLNLDLTPLRLPALRFHSSVLETKSSYLDVSETKLSAKDKARLTLLLREIQCDAEDGARDEIQVRRKTFIFNFNFSGFHFHPFFFFLFFSFPQCARRSTWATKTAPPLLDQTGRSTRATLHLPDFLFTTLIFRRRPILPHAD